METNPHGLLPLCPALHNQRTLSRDCRVLVLGTGTPLDGLVWWVAHPVENGAAYMVQAGSPGVLARVAVANLFRPTNAAFVPGAFTPRTQGGAL